MNRKWIAELVVLTMLVGTFAPAAPVYAEDEINRSLYTYETDASGNMEEAVWDAEEPLGEIEEDSAEEFREPEEVPEESPEEVPEESPEEIPEEEEQAEGPDRLGAAVMPVELYINDGNGSGDNTTVTLNRLSGAGWTYDPDENILTLQNFHGSYLECRGNLTVYLKGSNTLTVPSDSTDPKGISMSGKTLTINADTGATLTVSCNCSRNTNVHLIESYETDLNAGKLILTGQKSSQNNSFYIAQT